MTDIQLLKVRVQSKGPGSWQLVITDAETGRILPVMWTDRPRGIEIRDEGGFTVIRVDLIVHEMDIDAVMPVMVR